MYKEQPSPAGEPAGAALRTNPLNQQITEQDAVIQALEQRLSDAVHARSSFSFTQLNEELSIETELSAARANRGTFLYDRDFGKVTEPA